MTNDSAVTRILVICGASGTGKTVTAWEIGRVLQRQGVPHALIDTDELDRVRPRPEPIEALISVSHRNLQAVWSTFFGLGVRRLVLCGVMTSIQQSKPWIEEAVTPATTAFVRLTADRTTRERRLRDREAGSGFEQEMQASDRAAAFIEGQDETGVPVVATDGKRVAGVAKDVLQAAGWDT